MAARFRLTPNAESQLGDILEFIATDSESAAVRVRDAMYEAFGLLASHPQMGHARQDLTARPLRFWSVYSYLVVYDPSCEPLAILAVLHGARDVEQILRNP